MNNLYLELPSAINPNQSCPSGSRAYVAEHSARIIVPIARIRAFGNYSGVPLHAGLQYPSLPYLPVFYIACFGVSKDILFKW